MSAASRRASATTSTPTPGTASPVVNLIHPIPVPFPEPSTAIAFHDFIPARNKQPLLKASANRKQFVRALRDPEASLLNAEQIAFHGHAYLQDLFSLMDLCEATNQVSSTSIADLGSSRGKRREVVPSPRPLPDPDESPTSAGRRNRETASTASSSGAVVEISRVPLLSWASGFSTKRKPIDPKTFTNFRDICHFEIIMTGLSIAAAKLAVCGFTVQKVAAGSTTYSSSSFTASGGPPAMEGGMGEVVFAASGAAGGWASSPASGAGSSSAGQTAIQSAKLFDQKDLETALQHAKEAHALYEFLVEFNGRLSVKAIQDLFPEIDPRMLDALLGYAHLCMNVLALEAVLNGERRATLKKSLLASIAENNRTEATQVMTLLRPFLTSSTGRMADFEHVRRLSDHCEEYAAIMGIVANGFKAEELYEANDFGKAEGFANIALKKFYQDELKVKFPRNYNMHPPDHSTMIKTPSVTLTAMRKTYIHDYWKGKLREIVKENSTIYFQPVPDPFEDQVDAAPGSSPGASVAAAYQIAPRSLATNSQKFDAWKSGQRSFSVEELRLVWAGENEEIDEDTSYVYTGEDDGGAPVLFASRPTGVFPEAEVTSAAGADEGVRGAGPQRAVAVPRPPAGDKSQGAARTSGRENRTKTFGILNDGQLQQILSGTSNTNEVEVMGSDDCIGESGGTASARGSTSAGRQAADHHGSPPLVVQGSPI
ncbi:unnamed protein product [Amoebophrya sp. A120]|nr:unnamed protein product [Amoebophrya sp. A120]|eukprot:GSA120T00008786001.1